VGIIHVQIFLDCYVVQRKEEGAQCVWIPDAYFTNAHAMAFNKVWQDLVICEINTNIHELASTKECGWHHRTQHKDTLNSEASE